MSTTAQALSMALLEQWPKGQEEVRPLSAQRVADDSEVVILARTSHIEAMATAQTLRKMLMPHISKHVRKIPQVLVATEKLPGSTKLILLICTEGVFHDKVVLQWLCEAGRRDCMGIPVIAEDGFGFPHPSVLKGLVDLAEDATGEGSFVLNVITGVFRNQAVPFNTRSFSETVLAASAAQLGGRILGKKGDRPHGLSSVVPVDNLD